MTENIKSEHVGLSALTQNDMKETNHEERGLKEKAKTPVLIPTLV